MAPAAPDRPEVIATLPPLATSPSTARTTVDAELHRLGCDSETVERILAVVSELVANVVCHARTEAAVALVARNGTVRVEVSDSSRELPVLREPDNDALDDHGRGLFMVRALSDRWGVEHRDDGKTVWAEFHPHD